MNPTRCIIVDDEPLAIRLLNRYVEQVDDLVLVDSFTSPVKALSFLRSNPLDLIFLDIQMPGLTGIDFARSMSPAPAVIFTTAYRDYAVESYELEVVDYLIKPITFSRFYQAVDKFWRARSLPHPAPKATFQNLPEYRDFNVDKRYVRIKLSDIRYIESLKDYVRLHTTSGRYVTKESITELAGTLPGNFIRCHRSYVVNLDHLSAYTARAIELDGDTIPIGASYRREVAERLG